MQSCDALCNWSGDGTKWGDELQTLQWM